MTISLLLIVFGGGGEPLNATQDRVLSMDICNGKKSHYFFHYFFLTPQDINPF